MNPRDEFGRRLRETRERIDNLEAKQVAAAIGITADLASRYETGKRWITTEHAKAWADAVHLTDEETAELLAELEEGKALEKRLQSTAPYGQKAAQATRSKLLKSASRIRTFALTEIPFYLQTAEYARQSLAGDRDADAVAEMRHADGQRVREPGKNFEIILAESALRFLPCDPATMRGQLSQLQGLIDAPGVGFGIIPFGARLSEPLRNSFSMFDETTLIDTTAGEIELSARAARRYIDMMNGLLSQAVHGGDARKLLAAAEKALDAN